MCVCMCVWACACVGVGVRVCVCVCVCAWWCVHSVQVQKVQWSQRIKAHENHNQMTVFHISYQEIVFKILL